MEVWFETTNANMGKKSMHAFFFLTSGLIFNMQWGELFVANDIDSFFCNL
jgi:hypothetical protein